jgi:iron complex outermembrane receptor protein
MALRRLCGFMLLCLPVMGQTQLPSAPGSLADASLEDLMNIEVTSVSKKAQRLSSTAASVYVITSEDIRRSGLELPDVLRLAPGVQVARVEAGRWAVSIRGFNNDFSNKLMVLVDGRSVYSEVNPGVMWDMVHVASDDIERIEVIRGPNAALWGENAVNGVISIITKSSKETKGGLLTAEAGSETEGTGTVRFGGELGLFGRRRPHAARTTRIHAWLDDGQPGFPHGLESHGCRRRPGIRSRLSLGPRA